ncbi:MAG: hypothetical protein AB7G51_04915, partial [Steroidobacteraceae bacterium]
MSRVLASFAAGLLAAGSLTVSAAAEPGLDAALATQPYPAPPATPAQVLIRNGTVWTMDAAGVLELADVLLENGRIAAIGRGLQAGKVARVID